MIAPRLSEVQGQQVVVDNRGGASGLIGSELAVRAAPDGYTLLIVTQTHLISTTLHDRFHLAREYTSIGMVGGTPFVILASGALQARNSTELIALAKAKRALSCSGPAAPAPARICAWSCCNRSQASRSWTCPTKAAWRRSPT
ncbi:MAG: hypothetical protein FJY56_01710 [Betaproteobacteria bacterium]|nr:hypothetical protein [Betaproteobacteria bacterium]